MSAVFEVAADPLRDVFVDHHRSLLRMAASVLQGADDPEDVVHDAWLRCWCAAIGPAPGFELAYVRAAVRNVACNRLRSAEVRRRRALADATVAPEPDERALLAEEHATARQLLAGLAPRQRDVVVMRYLLGMSERETAAGLDVSVGSVKTHAHRGLQALRAGMAAANTDPA